ncbi:MAG TPA: SDR family oxidoreductase [Acidimicrobiia bacterium]|jgi:NAD(P)-dependent dehydrogenase (short-subunit alcohol dehydrogenase family)
MVQPSGGLEGYAALVTGGGTGIGRACAARLAADGAAVTIVGRTESRLAGAVTAITDVADATGHGGRAQYAVADVTDEATMEAAVARAVEPTGALDAVVANAGGGGGMAPPHLQDVAEFRRVLELNVVGTLVTMKRTVPHLVASRRGSFVGMSSIAGSTTHLWFGGYVPAKAGIEALVRNAADEYGPTGTRFNVIRPGFIATEIMGFIPRDSAVYESYLANTPMAPARETGVGEPEDVAALARFLVGEDSRWITGMVVNVDGGHHLRRGPDFSAFVEPRLGRDVMEARTPRDTDPA